MSLTHVKCIELRSRCHSHKLTLANAIVCVALVVAVIAAVAVEFVDICQLRKWGQQWCGVNASGNLVATAAAAALNYKMRKRKKRYENKKNKTKTNLNSPLKWNWLSSGGNSRHYCIHLCYILHHVACHICMYVRKIPTLKRNERFCGWVADTVVTFFDSWCYCCTAWNSKPAPLYYFAFSPNFFNIYVYPKQGMLSLPWNL